MKRNRCDRVPPVTDAHSLPSRGPAPDPIILQRPVGEVVRAALGPEGLATASYDATELWRFRLSRVWTPSGPRCVFVMLNPSTATESVLDRTVAKCVRFAKDWGFGSLEVVNAFAYRATRPADMKAFPLPVGVGNDEAITAAAQAADLVVAAWGVHGVHLGREAQVRALLAGSGADTRVLRLTAKGHPGHPLYVRRDTRLELWV